MYLQMERDAKEFQRANTLYWRAMKVVAEPDSFVVAYNEMK